VTINLNEVHNLNVIVDFNLDICGEWTKDKIISDILDSNNEGVKNQQMQPTITSKQAKLVLKYYVNILKTIKVWKMYLNQSVFKRI